MLEGTHVKRSQRLRPVLADFTVKPSQIRASSDIIVVGCEAAAARMLCIGLRSVGELLACRQVEEVAPARPSELTCHTCGTEIPPKVVQYMHAHWYVSISTLQHTIAYDGYQPTCVAGAETGSDDGERAARGDGQLSCSIGKFPVVPSFHDCSSANAGGSCRTPEQCPAC